MKKIYVTYMSKHMEYIFGKICIIEIYFAYIFYIKVKYIRQNIFSCQKVVYVAYIFYFQKVIFLLCACFFLL